MMNMFSICRSESSFLRSEFRGQLPKSCSDWKNATRLRKNHFNDQNKEHIDLNVSSNEINFIGEIFWSM
jgi:hypothetical protein